MKKDSLKPFGVIAGAILFNIFFWSEKLALNGLLFDVFIIAAVFYFYPFAIKNHYSRWVALGNILTAAMVVIHNTILSKIGCGVTLLFFVAFSQYTHRSALYAGGSVVLNYVLAIPNFFRSFGNVRNRKYNLATILRPIRMLLVPAMLLGIFFIIYALANTVFSNIACEMVTAVLRWIANMLSWLSIPRFSFFLLGMLITAGLILAVRDNSFSVADMAGKDDLRRKKGPLKKWRESLAGGLLTAIIGKASTGMLAIKNEFKIGLISLVFLNILLLFINFLDIKYVWLGFTFSKDVSLSAYVHEGAGLLIFSIVLAMVVLLFFFRGNLNFYKANKFLKWGAYLWIIQNGILVISVLIRDYYYIVHYGLAYKRIGLLFFLAMVAVGLLTVFWKIRFAKTTYYLLRINAWAALFLLVSASTVHWDYTIAKYNLARKSSIPLDIPFLLSLSDKTLPLIEMNKDVLENDNHTWVYYKHNAFQKTAFEFSQFRKNDFLEEQKNYTWLSWNAADDYVKNAFNVSSATTFTNSSLIKSLCDYSYSGNGPWCSGDYLSSLRLILFLSPY